MNTKKNVELSMKELLIVFLRKWWIIGLSAALVAGIFGVKSYFDFQANKEELFRRYQVNLDAYNQEMRTKEETIQYFKNRISAGEIYNDNSILMQLDPFNLSVASMTISIQAQRQNNESASLNLDSINSTISNMYRTYADNAPLSVLIQENGSGVYQENYLKELLSVESMDKGFLTLKAMGNDILDPASVLNIIFDYIKTQQDVVTELTRQHQLTSLGVSSAIESDDGLAKLQNDSRASLAENSVKIKNTEEELDKLRRAKPASPDPIRGSIRNAAIALVISAILTTLLVLLDYIVHIAIQTGEQIQSQLEIRYLKGGLFRKGKLFGRWGDRLSGTEKLAVDNDILAIVKANIKEAVCGKHQLVLVTGTVSQSVLEMFTGELLQLCGEKNTEFTAARDIANNASAVEILEFASAVIFVERIGESRLKDVYHSVERVRQSEKEIIGYTLR